MKIKVLNVAVVVVLLASYYVRASETLEHRMARLRASSAATQQQTDYGQQQWAYQQQLAEQQRAYGAYPAATPAQQAYQSPRVAQEDLELFTKALNREFAQKLTAWWNNMKYELRGLLVPVLREFYNALPLQEGELRQEVKETDADNLLRMLVKDLVEVKYENINNDFVAQNINYIDAFLDTNYVIETLQQQMGDFALRLYAWYTPVLSREMAHHVNRRMVKVLKGKQEIYTPEQFAQGLQAITKLSKDLDSVLTAAATQVPMNLDIAGLVRGVRGKIAERAATEWVFVGGAAAGEQATPAPAPLIKEFKERIIDELSEAFEESKTATAVALIRIFENALKPIFVRFAALSGASGKQVSLEEIDKESKDAAVDTLKKIDSQMGIVASDEQLVGIVESLVQQNLSAISSFLNPTIELDSLLGSLYQFAYQIHVAFFNQVVLPVVQKIRDDHIKRLMEEFAAGEEVQKIQILLGENFVAKLYQDILKDLSSDLVTRALFNDLYKIIYVMRTPEKEHPVTVAARELVGEESENIALARLRTMKQLFSDVAKAFYIDPGTALGQDFHSFVNSLSWEGRQGLSDKEYARGIELLKGLTYVRRDELSPEIRAQIFGITVTE